MNNDTVKTKDFSYQESPIPGHTYTLTWDPAKSPDFSVITVVDRDTGRVAVFDHGNLSEYRSQVIRVLALASKYNKASIAVDTTGIGAHLFDQLKELGIPVKAVYKILKGHGQ